MTEGDPSAEISAVTSGYQDPEIHGLKHTKIQSWHRENPERDCYQCPNSTIPEFLQRRDFGSSRSTGRSELLLPEMCYIPQIVFFQEQPSGTPKLSVFSPFPHLLQRSLFSVSLHLSLSPFPIQDQQRCLEMVLTLLQDKDQGSALWTLRVILIFRSFLSSLGRLSMLPLRSLYLYFFLFTTPFISSCFLTILGFFLAVAPFFPPSK